jgi:glycosyltransferase involved in cell wall biosynthesis
MFKKCMATDSVSSKVYRNRWRRPKMTPADFTTAIPDAAAPGPVPRRATILYLVTEDWYFLLHRLPMARAAAAAGYQVHLATHVNKDREAIERLGIEVHPLNWRRGSLYPFAVASVVREIRRLYARLQPDIVHHVTLQSIIIGSLASTGMPFVQLNSFFGLGSAFTSPQLKSRILGTVLKLALPRLAGRPHALTTVENADDKAFLSNIGLEPERIVILPGSGVDIERFKPLPEPEGPITAAFAGRLLDDKGIRTLIAAYDLLARRGTELRLLVAGEPDPANPRSIPLAEIDQWKSRPGLALMGHVSDISSVWTAAHFAVLPSRREGLPVSLLEAAACGRPLVATDVPGCREIARPGVNALLVPPDDPAALAAALDRMITDRELRQRLGRASRHIVETEYSDEIVGREIRALYDRVSARDS